MKQVSINFKRLKSYQESSLFKITIRIHFIPIRMAITKINKNNKTPQNISVHKDLENLEPRCLLAGMSNGLAIVGNFGGHQ